MTLVPNKNWNARIGVSVVLFALGLLIGTFQFAYRSQAAGTGKSHLTAANSKNATTTFANPVGTTYTWNGLVNSSWQVAANWTPTRTLTATSDVLVFNGTVQTVTNVPTEEIAELDLVSGASIILKAETTLPAGDKTLTVSGGAGANRLTVPTGTSLTLAGTTNLSISLASGSACLIEGQIALLNAAHKLLAADAASDTSGITFATGSIFTAGHPLDTGFSGNPFGSGADLSVRFQDTSSATFNEGDDAFGGSGHSVATFNLGSSQSIFVTSALSYDGRTYGYLTLDGSQSYSGSGTNVLTIFNTLTIASGSTLTLSNSSGGDLNLLGDVTINGTLATNNRTVKFQGGGLFGGDIQNVTNGGTFGDVIIAKSVGSVKLGNTTTINGALQFNGTSSAVDVIDLNTNTLNLNGTVGGTSSSAANGFRGSPSSILNIGGTGALGTLRFISGTQSLRSLSVNRTSSGSVTLGTNLTIVNALTGTLNLTNGVVDVGSNTLSLAASSTISRTNGYVIGSLQKTFGATGSFTFTVGTANGYSPLDANVTAGVSNSLTVKAVQGKQPNIHGTNALQRYWQISTSGGVTANLTFHYNGASPNDIVGTEANYKLFKFDSAQVFTQFTPNTLDTTNHLATLNGVSSFSDWTLAEPAAVQSGTISFVSAPYTNNETNADHNFTVTLRRSGGSDGAVSVHYATSAGTATAGSDYTETSSDLTWNDGDTADKTFMIAIKGDTTYEANETVNVTLSAATGGASIGTPNPTTLTITNDDPVPANQALVVNTTDDNDFGGCVTAHCSLREAINAANSNADTNTISFSIPGGDPGCSGGVCTINLATALPNLATDMTITGTGASSLTVKRSTAGGTPNFRIFNIQSGKTVSISGLTVSGGNIISGGAGGGINGGGIYNDGGTLTLTNITVGGNTAINAGGGIFNNSGTITLMNSTVSGNSATSGGGIVSNGGTLTITGSGIASNSAGSSGGGGVQVTGGTATMNRVAISNNVKSNGGGGGVEVLGGSTTVSIINCLIAGNGGTLGSGGGIFINGSQATVVNSTISGNSSFEGGGILNAGTVTLTNVTLTNNRGTSFGGGISGGGTTTLRNTIVAGNFHGASPSTTADDIFGTVVAASSFNLIGTGSGGLTGSNNNQVGVPNPLLSVLANNGGPTQTHALLPGSRAINAGSNANLPADTFDLDGDSDTAEPLPVDQRGTGFARVVNTTVDIGAFESGGFTISPTSGSGQSATITTAFSSPLVATVTSNVAGEPVAGGQVTFAAPAIGPSGTFPGSVITTNATINGSGAASSPTFTANGNAGSYSVSASGSGITTPAAFSLTNTQAATSTSVASSANPSDFGQTVTFTATVSSTAGVPTGTVQFMDGVNNLGSATCVAGSGNTCTAQVSTSTLTVGMHNISATYSGDANFVGSNVTLSGGQQVKAQPSLSINDISLAEGDAGTKNFVFTVTLSAASNLTVRVDFATANGTATTDGSDYQPNSGTLTFNSGDTTKTITVLVNGDQFFEPNETFFVNLSNPTNATISDNQGMGTIVNDDAQGGIINLSQTDYPVSEAAGFVTLTVNRSGDTTSVATVDYATDDTGSPVSCGTFNGLASSRCDFTTALGTLKFAANETQKTFVVLVNRDSYTESPSETLRVTLSNQTGGAVLATPSNSTVTILDSAAPAPNAIDDVDTFVRTHYHDFLNREADTPGLNFWKNEITSCGSDTQCIEVKRINVSAAFFLSIEFQQTGYLVERIYKAAYGDASGASTIGGAHQLSVPVIRLDEFLRDSQQISQGVVVLQGGWEQVLENNKQSFTLEFVQRSRFVAAFPTAMAPTDFVARLFINAGVLPTFAERQAAINEFGSATNTADVMARSRALRRVADNSALVQQEFNRAFVLMQYFGYLRRNPDNLPDTDYSGYDFWLTKLNQFNGNFIQAEMVKAFLSSDEYRRRFGP